MLSPFDTLKYDRVTIYTLKDGWGKGEIVMNSHLIQNALKYKDIDEKDSKELIKLVDDTATYGGPIISCSGFNIGVVFYLNEVIVGYLSISADCGDLYSFPLIPTHEKHKIRAGEEEGYYIYGTLSNIGKSKIMDFFKRFGLTLKMEMYVPPNQ